MPGNDVEVDLSTLRTTAVWLGADATDLGTAGREMAAAASAAGAACGGGQLTAALARFSAELMARTAELDDAISRAGVNLTANADRYAADDHGAAAQLGRAWMVDS